jgi:tetraacyldisaccharide 4'-kinase
MKGKDVISLSSIGNPESFEKTLESIGLNILKKIRFPDHHWFTIDEIRKILENKKYVVTTEKDAVRIKNLFFDDINLLEKIFILKIAFEVQNEEKLFEEIQKKCSGLH